MNNLTTPMAILISGILIALVIAFKDSTPKYSIVHSILQDEYLKLNHETGEVCWGSINPDRYDKDKMQASNPNFKFCE